jgi:hypothetical protein
MEIFMRIQNQMPDQLQPTALADLISERPGPVVSIYMPTNERLGHAVPQEPLLLRQLVAQISGQLTAKGWTPREIRPFLQPLEELAAPNHVFWHTQQRGLAIFLAQDFFKIYHLPHTCLPQAQLGAHFALRPLLPLLQADEPFYLLTLSQNKVQLYHGTAAQLAALTVPALPTTLAEILRYDQFERSLQYHSSGSSGGASTGRRAAIFHGQGAAGDERIKHQQLDRFLQAVEQSVTAYLADQRAPLFLAGVAYIQQIYRQHNHYANLAAANLPGNVDQALPSELHRACQALLTAYHEAAKAAALARYIDLAPGVQTVAGIDQVLPAAQQKRIDTLFVPAAFTAPALWGHVDPVTGQLFVSELPTPADEELINLALIHTLRARGTVYPVVPTALPNGAIGAILRY